LGTFEDWKFYERKRKSGGHAGSRIAKVRLLKGVKIG